MSANIQPNDWFNEVSKPKISIIGQFGILLGMVGFAVLIAAFIQLIFVISMGCSFNDIIGGNEDKIFSAMSKPENLTKAMLLQTISTLVIMAIPAFALARIITKKPTEYLGFSSKIDYQQILLVVAIAIVGMLLSGSLGEVSKLIPLPNSWKIKADKLEASFEKGVMIFANMKTTTDYLLSILMIAILPAIFEELLFRGALQKVLIDWFKRPHIAILVASILFSLVHLSIYGFLSRMVLGMVLGYVFYYSKNIWLNILMHFINNGVGITLMYIAMKKGASAKDSMSDTLPVWVAPIAIIVMIVLLWFYKKVCENRISKFEDVKV
jgi:uncharacterized protein